MNMRVSRMKKQLGFSLVEFAIAMGVTSIALAGTMLAFKDATSANQNVALRQDIADNLRAGLNLIEQDLIQTGTGIPTGGIAIPSTANGTCPGGYANVLRPLLTGSTFFPHCNVVLPAIEPGNALGPFITSPDATSTVNTDIITIMYQDNSLTLDTYPIKLAAGSGGANPTGGCSGSIASNGSSVTFDPYCVVSPSPSGATINAGDLIMFSNANGNALVMVTSVAWPTINFAGGDPFQLNQTGAAAGTMIQLQSTPGVYPPTTAKRITMVTYYLDNTTVPNHVQLIRRVNFNAGQTVGDTMENLQFTYNFNDGIATNQIIVPSGYSESQIRSVNIYVGARSDQPFTQTAKYLRSNFQTQVSLRSMSYFNSYVGTGN
jgi:type II secretory pathway pseudopilin PulG